MKKYLTILLVLAFAASMLFMGISCNYGAVQAVEEEEAVAEEAAPAEEEVAETEVKSGTEHEVVIEDFTFIPSDLTIKAGDTITWTNNDGISHTVKIDTFESDSLSKGDTSSFTFDNAGTYEYICGIHPYMHGKIIVE